MYSIVSKRQSPSSCCFSDGSELFGEDSRIVFRHFATLFFIIGIDSNESVLGVLDLIQVFVQVLDSSFENVCELDIVFHFDKVNYALDEIIQGGLVLETNVPIVTRALDEAKKKIKEQSSWL
eukprot:GHVR01068184.1.p1 GENE.GHVR01068184.1~~GHVR01068184.1.p1  ORF type:complete len:122 (+),score=14.41 GHVR01068184.1:210-575(+)